MRMDERGLGTGALVGIIVGVIVAIVVPVTILAVVLGGGGTPGGLPLYAGAGYLAGTTQGSTTTNLYDLGTANLTDVYNWYKTEMPKQRWTLAGDSPISGGYVLQYTKGNDTATITVIEGTIQGFNATKFLELYYVAGTPSGGNGGDGGVPC